MAETASRKRSPSHRRSQNSQELGVSPAQAALLAIPKWTRRPPAMPARLPWPSLRIRVHDRARIPPTSIRHPHRSGWLDPQSPRPEIPARLFFTRPLLSPTRVCQTHRVLIGLFPELDAPGGIQRAGCHMAFVLANLPPPGRWNTACLSLNDTRNWHRMRVGDRAICLHGSGARKGAICRQPRWRATRRHPKLVLAAHVNLAPIVRAMQLAAPRMKSIVCTHASKSGIRSSASPPRLAPRHFGPRSHRATATMSCLSRAWHVSASASFPGA